MNFMLTRAEVIALTGFGRTETFALQKSGQLITTSSSAKKGWFELAHVLICVAQVHNLPQPDAQTVEMHARLVVNMRVTKSSKPN